LVDLFENTYYFRGKVLGCLQKYRKNMTLLQVEPNGQNRTRGNLNYLTSLCHVEYWSDFWHARYAVKQSASYVTDGW